MPLSRLLVNRYERMTHAEIVAACEKWGLAVHPKVRVADVADPDANRVSGSLKTYALQAHFDFTIYKNDLPHYAVEYDGPQHDADPAQRERDRKKAAYCEAVGLPLLRVRAAHLQTNMGKSVLRWLLDVHELERGFYEAQEAGHIPWDEPFCPFFFFEILPDKKGVSHPYSFADRARRHLHALARNGTIPNYAPTGYIGLDEHQHRRGYQYLKVGEDKYVYTDSGMRSQQFPITVFTDLLDEVMTFNVHKKLVTALEGKGPTLTTAEVRERAEKVRSSTHPLSAHWMGGDEVFG